MTPLIENAWEMASNIIESKYKKEYIFQDQLFDQYDQYFRKIEEIVKTRYMDEKTKHLDRHKFAAIIMISIVHMQPIKRKDESGQKIFLGNEVIAAEVGLSYMHGCLNQILKEYGFDQKIKHLAFPKVLSCDRKYFEVLCRNLYYAKQNEDWCLNPIELADKLFLVEYITLIRNNIDIKKLKRKLQEKS